jgi:hypothetical protein
MPLSAEPPHVAANEARFSRGSLIVAPAAVGCKRVTQRSRSGKIGLIEFDQTRNVLNEFRRQFLFPNHTGDDC